MQGHEMSCEAVQMAVWARLDGEVAGIALEQIDRHVKACRACRDTISEIERLHRDLGRVDYERLDADLWPKIAPGVAAAAEPRLPQVRRFAALIAVLVSWRVAQLLVDLPVPVINSVVPLACIVFVLWRLAGDPFAIQISPHHFRQERAS